MSSSSVKRPTKDQKVFSLASSDIKADRYRICSRFLPHLSNSSFTNIVLALFIVSIRLAQLRYDLTSLGFIEAFPVRFLQHCSRIKRLGSINLKVRTFKRRGTLNPKVRTFKRLGTLNPKVRTYRLSTHNPPRFKSRT